MGVDPAPVALQFRDDRQRAPFDLDSFLAALPAKPGVYRMLGADDTILYVGKARHLKNRVSSYFHGRTHADKTLALLGQVKRIEVTVTASETEALLLEFNLIKRHRPRYNVLLKDDKSFPYIHLTAHEFPRLAYYRGTRKLPGRFFGPYPNSVAARETLQLLQKLFRIRPCEDTFFANRSRPCLQHQIGRCSAPCVGLVTREAYAQDIADAAKVLEGRNTELIADLGRRMEAAAERLQFEAAARFRDQIAMLKQIQASQSMTRIAGRDIDAVAIAGGGPEFCVSVVFVRGGRNLGSTNFFPRGGLGGEGEALAAFLSQYYLTREAPDEILVSRAVEDVDLLETALRERAGRNVPIRSGVRGTRARWLEMARTNAELGLKMKASSRATVADAARSAGGRPGAGQDPGAHRVLRRQPHDGRIRDRRLRRARARGTDQGRLPALQSRRPDARRRLRGIAAGGHAPLHARAARRTADARRAADRRWRRDSCRPRVMRLPRWASRDR